MKKYLFIIGLFYLFFSCSNEKVDENILSKELMVQIITDMELAKAVLLVNNTDKRPEREQLYNAIYNNYHTTKQNFDQSLLYYSKKPEDMEQIYNEVITSLSQKQAVLAK